MEKQRESQSWFDDLVPPPVDEARQSSPNLSWFDNLTRPRPKFDARELESGPSRFAPPVTASVFVVEPQREPEAKRTPVWVLALAAIAGASVFILGVSLLTLL